MNKGFIGLHKAAVELNNMAKESVRLHAEIVTPALERIDSWNEQTFPHHYINGEFNQAWREEMPEIKYLMV